MSEQTINPISLEPLYLPWEEPNSHRVRADKPGDPALVVKGRRPSSIEIVQNLRREIAEWRELDYAYGCSDTSRELLLHWFGRSHRIINPEGESIEFNYYFCQREAIETLIYLMDVRRITSLSSLTAEYGGPNAEITAAGIHQDENRWPRYAFKVATGAGKTKVMSLAIVWSYFHTLRESESPMARHFLVIAPNLTVFERLREDFGKGRIFDSDDCDPLIPPAWRGDWNMSVVLQDEASGAATGGTIYLTNIHRVYKPKTWRSSEPDTYDWMGPKVSRAKALDTGEALRKRITSHRRLMILNDEAHHVWDPGSAWNDAIESLNETLREKYRDGLVAQLDFSATPKDNKGKLFKHIIVDAPLGEAVDGGIVKTPLIGRGEGLFEKADDNAAHRYENHLMLGYQRWLISRDEWAKSGKKALLFIMTESTEAADQITRRLNSDSMFAELNGKTINLHTNLKGKLKKRGRGKNAKLIFIEDEKAISDEDLRELRKLSRELDNDTSPYFCIVSVLMLREGWDIRNVTTIVPLRPYSAKAHILPEQTLGRGLRRMTLAGQAAEVVTVVEHPAFTSLYREELSQEGLPIEVVDVDKVPKTTVSIFPDAENKDLKTLNIRIPRLTSAHRIVPKLDDFSFEEIQEAFQRFQPLPLGEARGGEIDYEGRHMLTNEIIEQMKIKLPLLQSGVGAVSYYREEMERATKIRGTHATLAPLIQRFLEEVLFEERTSIFDERLISRLADLDVREHLRAVFVPLIRQKTTLTEARIKEEKPRSVTEWRPFQVTQSERHPTLLADHTPFNLVPCDRDLEVAFTQFADKAPDIAAFSKNAGPQALRIDYLASGGRLAFYTPDFFIRKIDGSYLLVETKGRQDIDVPAKARAAKEWCKSASRSKNIKWDYLFIPEGVFQKLTGNKIDDLARACTPALDDLIKELETSQIPLPFDEISKQQKESNVKEFISLKTIEGLPSRYRAAIDQAVGLYKFIEQKEGQPFGPAFQALLGSIDEAAKGMIIDLIDPELPTSRSELNSFFDREYEGIPKKKAKRLRGNANHLRNMLVYKNSVMPIGILSFCLEFDYSKYPVGGVFEVIDKNFAQYRTTQLSERVEQIRQGRNTFVAHEKEQLINPELARKELRNWIRGLAEIYTAHN